ncbi:MAG: AAA family ATPase [Saprospiraceae bacterium]
MWPALFPMLRSLIDRHRESGRFILLGSASPELIRDTSESLAGRAAYFELQPFVQSELPEPLDYRQHWLRGGFPESLLALDDAGSLDWRENFIRSYLERDLPLLGLRADPMLIRRLWTMSAHLNGQLLNSSALANSLDISAPTVRRYLNFLESAFLVRHVQPWFANSQKRLVKTILLDIFRGGRLSKF